MYMRACIITKHELQTRICFYEIYFSLKKKRVPKTESSKQLASQQIKHRTYLVAEMLHARHSVRRWRVHKPSQNPPPQRTRGHVGRLRTFYTIVVV